MTSERREALMTKEDINQYFLKNMYQKIDVDFIVSKTNRFYNKIIFHGIPLTPMRNCAAMTFLQLLSKVAQPPLITSFYDFNKK